MECREEPEIERSIPVQWEFEKPTHTWPESGDPTILSTTLIPAATLTAEYSSGEICIAVVCETLDGLPPNTHSPNIVPLHLVHAFCDII